MATAWTVRLATVLSCLALDLDVLGQAVRLIHCHVAATDSETVHYTKVCIPSPLNQFACAQAFTLHSDFCATLSLNISSIAMSKLTIQSTNEQQTQQ